MTDQQQPQAKPWYRNAQTVTAIIISVAIAAFLTYLLSPTKTHETTRTVMQADTGKVAKKLYEKAIAERDEALNDVGWWKRQFKLAQNQNPTGGGVTNPVSPPISPTPLPQAPNGSGEKPPVSLSYFYDFPISMQAEKGKISFFTLNPGLQALGKPYVKTYEFPRPTSDFEFALTQTENSNLLDGLKLRSNERFFSFDGLSVGVGAMIGLERDRRFYAMLAARFSMYERLHLEPQIRSTPEAGMEVKYDLFK